MRHHHVLRLTLFVKNPLEVQITRAYLDESGLVQQYKTRSYINITDSSLARVIWIGQNRPSCQVTTRTYTPRTGR